MTAAEERQFCSSLEDAALVLLAESSRTNVPVEVLSERHAPWMHRWVRACGTRWGLAADDVQDAQQAMALVLVEAIACFRHRLRQLPPTSQRFADFLRWRVKRRLRDFLRHLSRRERLYSRSAQATEALAERVCEDSTSNPASAAARNEALAAIDAVMSKLDDRERLLCEGWLTERPLPSLARPLGASCATIKRRRRVLRAKLQRQLKDCI